jgi:hypothetical protein
MAHYSLRRRGIAGLLIGASFEFAAERRCQLAEGSKSSLKKRGK